MPAAPIWALGQLPTQWRRYFLTKSIFFLFFLRSMSEYIHCRLRNSLCAKLIRGQLKLWDQTSGVRPTSGTRAAVATLVFNFPTINTLSVGDFFQTDLPPTLRRTWRPTTRMTPTPTSALSQDSRLLQCHCQGRFALFSKLFGISTR